MSKQSLETLEIKGRKSDFFIPHVRFDAATGDCLLEGESYLEDTWEFYDKLSEWLHEYIEIVKGPISFNFKLTYFNTSSSKGILDIMKILKDYKDNGGKVVANWHHPTNDVDNIGEAEDFMDDVELNMNLIPYWLLVFF